MTPITVLAKYELLVASIGHDHRMYERLLDRFEIELDQDRTRLKHEVHKHVQALSDKRRRGFRPTQKEYVPEWFLCRSIGTTSHPARIFQDVAQPPVASS